MLAAFSACFATEITTPRPSLECTTQNCIVSFANMADESLDNMIPSEQSGILALKFTSCQMESIPNNVFEMFPMLLCFMSTTPGLTSIAEDAFQSATNLQFLYLPGNQIKKLGPQSFRGAINLSEINLTDNEIEVVSENAFDGLEHLVSLSLCRNQIAFFGQSTFSSLTDLMNLDISGNMIEFLDARMFTNNENLNGINIADNQIFSITNGFLELLPQIKVLNLMNNPCTNNTMLENIPLIKIIDSKDFNSDDDEGSLDRCYQNYIDMADPESTDLSDLLSEAKVVSEDIEDDPESMDLNDLLSEAEVVREDIEDDIISELTEELLEKDVEIKRLERRDDLMKIFFLLAFTVCFFFGLLKFIIRIVEGTYRNELHKIINDKVEVVKIDPKQVVYTIEV